jgi:hypothetical protein
MKLLAEDDFSENHHSNHVDLFEKMLDNSYS